MLTTKSPSLLLTTGLAAVVWLPACFKGDDAPANDASDETETGDPTGDGDPETGDGDPETGDGDPETGDGDPDPVCGDGQVNGSEACDGSDLGGETCASLGFDAGELACTADCSGFDTAGCTTCGNGVVEAGEQCDDGNRVDGDGCDNDCTFTEILQIAASYQNTCALIEGGRVRCWGRNYAGQLGYGHTENIGDNETPASAGDVMLPEPGVELTMGDMHACILMADMNVRCWGGGGSGQLGYASIENIGDDEFPISIPDVNIGGPVLEVDAGGAHTCARLNDGKMRCWGSAWSGQLGYGNTNTIGDDEHPATAGDVPVGAAVVAQATGIEHTCAITAVGRVRCWGSNWSGELGYGHTNNVGATNTPANAGNVPAIPLGLPSTTTATALALGFMTCALYDTGDVLCWGGNGAGQLGQGHTQAIGDDEFPATYPPIELPGPVVHISAGDAHVCALLESQDVICWGRNSHGQLGYGHTDNIGDDETPLSAGTVQLGGPVKQVSAGGNHTCAIMAETNELYCWGINSGGELGLGHTNNIGDDELPTEAGPVELF